MTKVLVLNGPNIQRLGTREPEIYGPDTFEDLKKSCVEFGKTQNFEIDFRLKLLIFYLILKTYNYYFWTNKI